MKILRSEHRRRIRHDLDYALGLLQDIDKVVFKAYGTSILHACLKSAMNDIVSAKTWIPYTKVKIEYKHPRPLKDKTLRSIILNGRKKK